MYGAILGDMIGAPYEFDRGDKTKEFPLFSRGSQFTDDSVMTIAVAEALMSLDGDADDEAVHRAVSKAMQIWGRNYPDAGYGVRFLDWLFTPCQPKPYGSWGNGSAMRVSPVGWLYDTIEETRRYANLTAEVTHNHPEGIKGAEATASAIFMARNGATKDEIRGYIVQEFDYDLSRTCDEIRPEYHHVESCQETVPEAITAFLEGNDFEDVIRTAVSLGGDCDTLTCIAGAMAEAFYGVPEEMKEECRKRLPKDILTVLDHFEQKIVDKNPPFHDSFLHGKLWNAAFTSQAEFEKEAPSGVISNFIDSSMKFCLESETEGFIINPWGQSFLLAKELIEMIFQADGDVEYSVPDDPITPELLEDGSFLKRAIEICNRNRTQLNLIKLARNNEKNVKGIVINAFSEPFVIPKELFDVIAGMKSSFEQEMADND